MGEPPSDRKTTAVIVVCLIAILLSGLNIYLVLEGTRTQQEQLEKLRNDLSETRNRIKALETSLSSLDAAVNALNATELGTMVETLRSTHPQTPGTVYETAHKSVVVVRTPSGQGSGFLYGNQNLILTNWHVVAAQTDILVEFYDRTRASATLVGVDEYSDIAVIKVASSPVGAKPLQFGNSSGLWIGQQVVAIGNPLGFTGSLSSGYISQINKLIDLPPLIVPVLQLDITIAPGSSGGPLLDLSGSVVGITNAGTSVGFNFAIPSNIARRAASSIIEKGYYGHSFLGFTGIELTPERIKELRILNVDAFQTGLLIWEVVPNTPAAEAGLRGVVATRARNGSRAYNATDIILDVDGHATFSFEDWSSYIEEKVSPGQTLTLTLWRSGKIVSIAVTTTNRPPYR